MAESDSDEIIAMQHEFEWLLQEEVSAVLEQLKGILLECCHRLPVGMPGVDIIPKTEKYFMSNSSSSTQDQVKVVVTLSGDNISHADINLRIHKHQVPSHRTIVQNDCQWKLQQIQDAGNHLMLALHLLPSHASTNQQNKYNFRSAEEVTEMVNKLMSCLQRGRACLIIPKRKTIDELQKSRNMKSLQPPLPNDLAVSFYVQAHKLVFAVYHLQKDQQGSMKFDVYQAESSVPWLSEVLVLFTVSLQLCQQLKDKVSVFC
ncbi:protein rogdi-like isoform X1 [Limulus polyphemus]|uniref:Protein rogdi-like isoform X1 n=1 Tax=Limulus polyphemus TaxID=6850 RepID=A0ABM1B3V0_LIMPO|nr:protein rogdi-like isoform X1 [Limulus polyphemus]